MRNEKGEDWEKYLGELNDLQPLLRREMGEGQGDIAKQDYTPILNKDGTPLNDPTVKKREKGEVLDAGGQVLDAKKKKEKFSIVSENGAVLSSTGKKRKAALDGIKEHLDEYAKNIQTLINGWIEEEIRKYFPNLEWRALQEGNRWPIKKHGLFIDINHEREPLPFGSDIVTVYAKKKVIAQQKFVWEFDE